MADGEFVLIFGKAAADLIKKAGQDHADILQAEQRESALLVSGLRAEYKITWQL